LIRCAWRAGREVPQETAGESFTGDFWDCLLYPIEFPPSRVTIAGCPTVGRLVVYTTSLTLLQKLRDPNDTASWERFVDLYLPLLFFWARRLPVDGMDPADLVQDVFVKLVRELPQFTYNPANGGFRNWLRTVCMNCWRDHQRKRANHLVQADEAQLAALTARADGLEQFWAQDYHAMLMREAFRILEEEFDPLSRAAFKGVVLEGRSVQAVAEEHGTTPNAISMRKFRVVRRLREELADFLDEEAEKK
jgi:RNA polymerase sigma-70 factor (ECF subfamily)